jgi:hypothetical protein
MRNEVAIVTQHDDLVGSWRLVSIYSKNVAGDIFYPYGEDPIGLLVYSRDGYMSATLMRQGRAHFASGDMYNGTPQELKEAFEGFDAYSGPYDIDSQRRAVIHHVEACRYPNWEGSDEVRYFQLEGDVLRLYTPPIRARGTEWVVYADWERARVGGSLQG